MGRRAGTGSNISTLEEVPVIVLSVPVPLTDPSSASVKSLFQTSTCIAALATNL